MFQNQPKHTASGRRSGQGWAGPLGRPGVFIRDIAAALRCRCRYIPRHPTTNAPHTSVHCTTQIPRKQSCDSASINPTAWKTTTKQRCKCISREKFAGQEKKEGSALRKRIWPPTKWNRKWLKMEVRSQPELVAAWSLGQSLTACFWPWLTWSVTQRPHPPTCCESWTTPNWIRLTLAFVKVPANDIKYAQQQHQLRLLVASPCKVRLSPFPPRSSGPLA